MTEKERMAKAKELRDATVARRDFAQTQMAAHPENKPDAWWNASSYIVDSCWDRIYLIDALFPELGGVVDGKHT